jgi:ribosomal protein L11 methyltransferase
MNHFRIVIPEADPTKREIFIAQFSELGANGFEEDHATLKVYFAESDYDKEVAESLLKDYSGVRTDVIAETNWNAEWESSFEPVVVDDFCAVRAAFHHPVMSCEHEIIITPKMSFGTGHHSTTFQMIRRMRDIDFRQKTVLDFGTGTGVLAILASRLGADVVFAVDNEQWSIQNAEENIALNGVSNIRLRLADRVPADNMFDIILANINKNVILSSLSEIVQQMNVEGVVIVSGLLEGDRSELESAARSNRLRIKDLTEISNWICVTLCVSNN